MKGPWIGADGWPRDCPDGLPEAVAAIPGAERFERSQIDAMARLIADAALAGKDDERACSLPASKAATDKSLLQFRNLCERLADHVEAMRKPAIDALAAQGGLSVRALLEALREAQEAAQCAFGATDAPDEMKGRHRRAGAAEVTATCAHVFERITGRRPTFTTDPTTSRVSGPWLDFLGRSLAACFIKASAEGQARALMEKMAAESP